MDAIRTDALTKHYQVGFWRPRPYLALEGLTLSVAQGEVFGFLGPNGAGKTTTLKLLMQLIYPTSGTAEILGLPVGSAAVKRRIGYLPENPYFYDHLTAEEFLGLHRQRQVERVAVFPERHGLLDPAGLARAFERGRREMAHHQLPAMRLEGEDVRQRARRHEPAARDDRDPAAERFGVRQHVRARVHRVLQLARTGGRRSALQPGRDRRAR